MRPRFYLNEPLQADTTVVLPSGTSRHVQVLRLQPGAEVTLFNGLGGEWGAVVVQMGRSEVSVRINAPQLLTHGQSRELALPVTLALGMPTNERMDTVIEKATELGVQTIQPLMCERSVLRLTTERAQKKVAHWQAVAVAACEQSGRTSIPHVNPVRTLTEWLREPAVQGQACWILSLSSDAQTLNAIAASSGQTGVVCLSGPEGGLSAGEELAARAAGFIPVSLGPRVLRADTAPLAVLAYLALK
jgi:16S rRNA (uracil1498-N3)-methyltransferase